MKMAPGRRSSRGGRAVANVVICTKSTGNNCGIFCDMPGLLFVYQGGDNSRVQLDPDVVVAVPY